MASPHCGCLCAESWLRWWFNLGYLVALALLLLSGVAYNVEPVRLKDRTYLDVIAESFNNPVRLWLRWYALLPSHYYPPLSIVLAWWLLWRPAHGR